MADEKLIVKRKKPDIRKLISELPPIYISLFILLVLVVSLYIANHSFLSKYNLKVLADGTTIFTMRWVGAGLRNSDRRY